MRSKLLLLLVGLSTLGCGSSDTTPSTVDGGSDTNVAADSVATDTSKSDTATTDTAVSETPADTKPTETGAATCPFKGTYDIEKYFCDTTDITSSWKGVVPTSKITFTDIVAGGGGPVSGCHVVSENIAPSCDETEEYNFTFVSGTTYNEHKFGITKCNPAACTFTTGDKPCVIGDRADPDGFVTITKSGASLVITSPGAATDICGGKSTILTITATGV